MNDSADNQSPLVDTWPLRLANNQYHRLLSSLIRLLHRKESPTSPAHDTIVYINDVDVDSIDLADILISWWTQFLWTQLDLIPAYKSISIHIQ